VQSDLPFGDMLLPLGYIQMSSFKRLLCNICISSAITTISSPSLAQTIDYGSLQTLFSEPVTTSATGQPQRASEAPVTMKIITADDIRRSGANNIPDILRGYSGTSVWGWTRQTADVNIRGYNQAFSSRLLVLINGRQIYTEGYGNTLWENMPIQLEEIRQIEIVEGPNSALFGFNAVSGVINIITLNPMYDQVSSVGVRVGSDSFRQSHFVHTQKFGEKASVRISGGAEAMSDFPKPLNEASATFVDPTQHELSLDGMAQITDKSQLRLEVNQTRPQNSEYSYVYSSYNYKYATNSAKATYTAESPIGLLQATIYTNAITGKLNGSGNNFIFKNRIIVNQLEDLFKIGNNHTFRILGEYRHNALHGNVFSPKAQIFYDNYATSGMWNWKISDTLAWTNAGRVDHLELGRNGPIATNSVITSNKAFDKSLTKVSYNSGLVMNVSDFDTVRLMTSRGIQSPSLTNLGIDLLSGGFVAEGNPNIKPTIVNNYEISYDRKINDINGNFEASLFYQTSSDIKTEQSIITGNVIQAGNGGDSKTAGLELNLKGNVGENWNWDTSYTFQRIVDDMNANIGASVPYNGEDSTPRHKITLHGGYVSGPWEADAFAQYVSGYKVLEGGSFSFTSSDVGNNVQISGRVGYKINDNFTLAISGQGFAPGDSRETSGPKAERQVFLSLTGTF
jgi:outer membrane receptor for ferrienterochelin and colicins